MKKLLFLFVGMVTLVSGNLFAAPSCGDILACAEGCNYEGVKWYVDHKGYDLNIKGDFGDTTLHLVAYNTVNKGCLKIAQMLVKYKDVEMNARNVSLRTPLMNALFEKAEIGDYLLEMVDALLYKNDTATKLTDHYGWTILHYATDMNELQVVKKLIKKRVDVNQSDEKGWSPLHIAAKTETDLSPPDPRCVDIIDVLYRNKADINSTDNIGNTPLHVACGTRPENTGYLKGILNSLAAFKLADLGADPTIKNNNGETAIDVCEKYNHPLEAEYLKAKAKQAGKI